MSRKKKTTTQSYPDIELLAALAEEGCPICHNIARTDHHYFFWFFNESYYEPHTLDGLTRSLGFCLGHGASLARSVVGSQQLASVHQVLARRVRSMLADRAADRTPGERQASILATHERCPPCRERKENVERAAFWLARLLEDPSHTDRYTHPGALCYPHLQVVALRLSAPTFDRLLAIHDATMASGMDALRGLRADLTSKRPEGRQDLLKALLPSLRLAVGHDTGNGAYPSLDDSSPRGRDPVGDLLEWLRRAGACPVCLEIRRAWIEWFRWLDEAASQPLPLDDLLPSCPEHVWPTVHLGGPALAVVTAQHALGTALSEVRTAIRLLNPPPSKDRVRPLERLKRAIWGPRHRFRIAREAIARPVRCPVCARLAVAGDQILSLLFALLEDRQHQATVAGSYGLCLKHFSRALTLGPPPKIRAVLSEIETAKLARLHWELEESLRKVAWNYRPEAKGQEQTAWRRAVLRFSGSLSGDGG